MKTNVKEAGKRIKSIRDRFGYSMLSFALLLDISSASTVNNWEKGNNLPNKNRLEKIAVLGNTSSNWIKYGPFQDYVLTLLLKNHQNAYLSNKVFMNQLLLTLKKKGITYCEDIKIMQEYKQLLAQTNLEQSNAFSTAVLISEEAAVYTIETNNEYRETILPVIEALLQHPSRQKENKEILQHFLALLTQINSVETVTALNHVLSLMLDLGNKYALINKEESRISISLDKKELGSAINQFFNYFSQDLIDYAT